MLNLYRKLLNASILSLALMLAAMVLLRLIPGFPDKSSVIILVTSFFIMSVIILSLAFVGSKKESDSQMLFTFGAIGLKFVLSAIIALLYFEVFKKSGLNNILLFFVLYLTFTVYLVFILIKDLNTRVIKRD